MRGNPLSERLSHPFIDMCFNFSQNSKRLGNQHPEQVRTLENDVWKQVFAIAQGEKTALTACNELAQLWREHDILGSLQGDSYSQSFFRRSDKGQLDEFPTSGVLS